MNIDERFRSYFQGRLKQVFFYITDACGLQCEQCLYKTTLANREIALPSVLNMLTAFYSLGARKLTLIGGEPTLYGRKHNNKPLLKVIERASDVGYRYIRLDTNGQFKPALLSRPGFELLNNLAFSLDGHEAAINDGLRGAGTFDRCVANLEEAVSRGYFATITCCVHSRNIDKLTQVIDFATAMGAREVNFHPLFKMGIARDRFSGRCHLEPREWVDAYTKLRREIDMGRYSISVRLPRRFVLTSAYASSPDKYDYCPVRMGERALVHPDGTIRICALCIGTPLRVGRFDAECVHFDAPESELAEQRHVSRPCMSQTKDFGELTPLCISYKPYQSEFVWNGLSVDKDCECVPIAAPDVVGLGASG